MKQTLRILLHGTLICLGTFAVASTANAQKCPGKPTLKIDAHTLDFSEHKPVCVRPNGIFYIQLKPQNGYPLINGDITVREKAGSTKIRKEDIDGQGLMSVKVGNFTVGTDPQYKIRVKGVGVLDPRVRIIPSYQAMLAGSDEINDYLITEWGFSIPDLKELDSYLKEEYQTGIADLLVLAQRAEQSQEE